MSMFFPGHIAIGIIIFYLLSKRSRSFADMSLPLFLLLTIIPDVDIIFEAIGVEHKVVTHSLIISLMVAVPFIVRYRIIAVGYTTAYLSHAMIGDVIIGPLNVLSPFSQFLIGTEGYYGSIFHLILELLLVAITIPIIWMQFRNKSSSFNKKLDHIIYPMIALGILVSLFYSLYDSMFTNTGFLDSPLSWILFLMLHSISLALVIKTWTSPIKILRIF